MAITLRQSIKQSQKLMMTPQLQQAIKLLQLSRIELEEFITNELQENPVLEESEKTNNDEAPAEREITEQEVWQESAQAVVDMMEGSKNTNDEFASSDMNSPESLEKVDLSPDPDFNRYEESNIPTSTRNSDSEEAVNYENMVSKSKNLSDHLLSQLADADFDDDEKQIAQLIIGNVNEKGYFEGSLEELSQAEGLAIEKFEGVLDTLQRFDPPGVCSRDLRECLLIQIREGRLRNGIIEKIVDKHLDDLSSRNLAPIAKALKISIKDVIDNAKIISELDPNPGYKYQQERPNYIVPDVYIHRIGSRWHVTINNEDLPRLKVNDYYQDLEKHTNSKSAENVYLQDKIKSANWLINSIQQRQNTIMKVTECILKKQKEFFEKGVQFLKPMVLKDIAEEIEMHESTVSRVTSNKYVHTPRGIFELKYFFNSSVSGSDGGDDVASESVKSKITEIVKTENVKKPYSDQKIVEMLEEEGIVLARRTVAKYREQIGILPSSRRKRIY